MAVLYLYRLVLVAVVEVLSFLGLHSRIYLADYFQMTSVWNKSLSFPLVPWQFTWNFPSLLFLISAFLSLEPV